MKLYICFCEDYYTGVPRGSWYEHKPCSTNKENCFMCSTPEAYDIGFFAPNCHEWDGCGYYEIEPEQS